MSSETDTESGGDSQRVPEVGTMMPRSDYTTAKQYGDLSRPRALTVYEYSNKKVNKHVIPSSKLLFHGRSNSKRSRNSIYSTRDQLRKTQHAINFAILEHVINS